MTLASSGVDSTQNASVAQAASDGQLAKLSDDISSGIGGNPAQSTAIQTGYNDGMNGQGYAWAITSAGSIYLNNSIAFTAGYVAGYVNHLRK
jgi:hypothetical protein